MKYTSLFFECGESIPVALPENKQEQILASLITEGIRENYSSFIYDIRRGIPLSAFEYEYVGDGIEIGRKGELNNKLKYSIEEVRKALKDWRDFFLSVYGCNIGPRTSYENVAWTYLLLANDFLYKNAEGQQNIESISIAALRLSSALLTVDTERIYKSVLRIFSITPIELVSRLIEEPDFNSLRSYLLRIHRRKEPLFQPSLTD